jgi:outer membrane protein
LRGVARCDILALLFLWVVGSTAKAADPILRSSSTGPDDWIVTVGADVRAASEYMGSDDFAISVVPYFDMRRPGSPEGFHSPRDAPGFAVIDNGVFAAGPVGSLIWPRRQGFSASLNVGFGYQVGGFIDYWAVPWLRTRVEGLQAFGATDGVTAKLAVDAVVPLSSAVTWSGGLRARAVTSAEEGPYFSITPAQSIASGLSVFNAGGGWQTIGAGTQLKYRFSPAWASYGFVEYDKLVGASASSPIVTEAGGSVNQWTFGVGLTYSFAMGLPF